MDKIETLLYKVLIATESHDNGASCLPVEYFEKTKDCLNEGDIMCTSIDLLANKAVCYNCLSCSDNTVVPCKHYGSLNETLYVRDINVNILTDGSVKLLDIEKIKREDLMPPMPPCNCTWSRYNYTYIISHKPNVQYQNSTDHPELLRCQCDKDVNYDQLYCPLGDSCYNRNATCSVTASGINCTMVKYNSEKKGNTAKRDEEIKAKKQIIIIDEKCSQWETVFQSNCSINVNFDDKDMEIIRNLKPGNPLNLTDVGNKINIVCPESNCIRAFNVICNENFDIGNCNVTNNTVPQLPGKDPNNSDDDSDDQKKAKGNSYTTLLVVIIIVILLLFLLYVGYQNHQKVSTSTCTIP